MAYSVISARFYVRFKAKWIRIDHSYIIKSFLDFFPNRNVSPFSVSSYTFIYPDTMYIEAIFLLSYKRPTISFLYALQVVSEIEHRLWWKPISLVSSSRKNIFPISVSGLALIAHKAMSIAVDGLFLVSY